LDFLDRSNYTSLGSVKVNELNKLLLEEHVEFLIHKTHRKLKQHECSQRVYNCSIAQGLLLGRDYDHCGNCISNEGKDVDNVRMNKYVSMIKRKGINKRMAENLSDKIRGSSMWQYFPLIGKDTVKWMGRVFGNIKMEVSYFGEKNEGFFREVDSGKSKDLIKENELANQHKIFHFFNSDSNVRLINISNVKRQEKRNWPSD